MDRISFLHSINPGSLTTASMIVNYIDQSMLLYDLLEETDDVSVIDNSTNYISYQIKNKDINQTIDRLSNIIQPIQLYQSQLITKLNSADNDSINISIYK